MSGSQTIVVNGVTETVLITKFIESMSFDFGLPDNWSNGLPTIYEQNGTLYEADISYLAGGAQDGVNVVGGGGQQSDTTAGLLIDEPGASIDVENYLEVEYLPIINNGQVIIAQGGILVADGVAIESGYSVGLIDGLPFVAGIVSDLGTLDSGNVVEGGVFDDIGVAIGAPAGLISDGTELENLTFEGTLDLSHSGYNFVAFSDVAWNTYAGVYPIVLLNGVGGRFQTDGDETVANVTFVFGSDTGTIESAGSAEPGSAGDMILAPSVTLTVANTDFYVSNDCTIESQTDIVSDNATDVLTFAGQAFASGIIEPGSSTPTTVQAGLFENEASIVMEAKAASYEIFDIDFLNNTGAQLTVDDATLADHQFTSTFENAGTFTIEQGANVQAYDKGFINDATGMIEISVDQTSPNTGAAGTLAIGTMDVQTGGLVFTVAPTQYVNDGLIELVSNLPSSIVATETPEFYIGAGTSFSATGQTTLTNAGTILLAIGELNFNDVLVTGNGTIIGDGGTIGGDAENTITDTTLTGLVNLPTYTELLNDTFAANAFSAAVINVGYDLIIGEEPGLADMTINLNNNGSTVIMGLVTDALTLESSATLNAQGLVSVIRDWFATNGSTYQATFDNQGVLNATGEVTDIETTGFLNSGQVTLSDNGELNLFGVEATNQAGGSITIGSGSDLEIGSSFSSASMVNFGSIALDSGGYLQGLITLSGGPPLSIESGGILLGVTIVGGTISGDGGIAEATNLFNGVLYEGALNVEGTVELENGASFAPVGPETETINISTAPIGGAAELEFLSAISLSAGVINIGAATAPTPQILIDAGVTFGSGITVNQTAALAGISALGIPGALDNQGTLNATWLNGTFTIEYVAGFTNDGEINVSNGDTLKITSPFTQNADGVLSVSSGGVLDFGGSVLFGAGALVQLAAGSTLDAAGMISGGTFDLNGVDIAGSNLPGSGVLDGVTINDAPDTITGTVTFTDDTYNGSLVIEGDLLLGDGDIFQPETAGGSEPDINIVAATGTLDFIASQELNAVEIDLGGTSAVSPSELIVGQGSSVSASVTLGAGLTLDDTGAASGGAALITGTAGQPDLMDNQGQIEVNQTAGTFTIQSLSSGFTNDGGITVSNGDDLDLAAPFTENADGTFQVTGGGTLSVNAAMTIASGGTVSLTPSTTLSLGGATISSPGGGTLDVTSQVAITGTGALADVTLTGDPVIDGDLQLGAGVAIQSDTVDGTPTVSVNGTLDVLTSGTLTGELFDLGSPVAPSPVAAIVAGLGGEDANVTLAASTTIDQTGAAALLTGGSDGNSTLENDGQIYATEGGNFAITSLADFINVGDIAVENGESLTAGVTVTNDGTINDQSSATFQQALIGTGTIDLADNATVTFLGTVSSGQQIELSDGLIVIDDPMEFSGTIDNFGTDDALWFPDETVTDPTFTGSQLIFTDGSNNVVAINLQDVVDSPGPMQEKSDGAGGFFVGSPFDATLQCFAAGTRIATPMGETVVERLAAGDLVQLADGEVAEIIWLGHRAVDAARHSDPRKVWPVRVAAGAFGVGLPHRDLFLSPDHAIFLEGVLIPVRYLIDGDRIAQIAAATVTYFHVELASHEILLAEGLPVESYLETGDRAAFTNGPGAFTLFPDFSRRGEDHARLWEARGRAPLVIHGAALRQARALIRPAAAPARNPRMAAA